MHGATDSALFDAVLQRIVGEVDSLRVRFVEGSDRPRQVVELSLDWFLPIGDVSEDPAPRTAAQEWMTDDMARPRVLTRGPLFSYALIKFGSGRFFWCQVCHPKAMDVFGFWLVERPLIEVYTVVRAWDGAGSRFVWFVGHAAGPRFSSSRVGAVRGESAVLDRAFCGPTGAG
ncbi:MAG: condensation domain-containing protein [Pseudonocardiaceae bacterium]